MRDSLSVQSDGCEQLPTPPRPTPATDELIRIRNLLRAALPGDAIISFEFNECLQVHVDLAKREDVILAEALLPNLGAGLFRNVSRASTPNRPFHHRVSAAVNS